MSLKVLLVLTLALAGCSGKSAQSTIQDAAEAANAASAQAPLGNGRPAADPPAPTKTPASEAPGGPKAASQSTGPTPSSPTPAEASDPAPAAPASTSPGPSSLPGAVPAPPGPVTASCTVMLPGLQGLGAVAATAGTCVPAKFVSSTGASFTHLVVQVTQSAKALPATVLVQVKDASGTVIGTATGLGPLQVSVPAALVPHGPSVDLTAEVLPTGAFRDYAATLTFTLG